MFRRMTLLPLVILTGCTAEQGRLGITGEITFDGQPIADGYVTLEPLGEGPSAGGKIVDGKLTIAAERGPIAGQYRVKIEARRETGKLIPIDPSFPEETQPETESYIPPRYNEQSELSADVSPENRHFVWKLRSD